MGMSTHLTAFKSRDSKEFKKHEEIFRMCLGHGVSLPTETALFFRCNSECYGEYEIEESIEMKIKHHEYCDDARQGFEILVSEIPKDVEVIRFYNAW